MAGKYEAGSVSAKIELDTSQFEEAIQKLRADVDSLRTQMGDSTLNLSSQINSLKKDIELLKKENEALKKSFHGTGEGVKSELNYLKNLSPEFKKNIKNVNDMVKANDKLTKSMKQQEAQTKKTANSMKQQERQITKTLSKLESEFTDSFYNKIWNAKKNSKTNLTLIKPIYDALKDEFKSQVKNKKEFDGLIATALPIIGSKVVPSRDASNFQKLYSPRSNTQKNWAYFDTSKLKDLKTYASTLDQVQAKTEKVTAQIREVTEAEIVSARETLGLTNNVYKLGESFQATLKPLKQVETQAKLTTEQLIELMGVEKLLEKNRWAYSFLNSYKRKTFLPISDLFEFGVKDYHLSDEENKKFIDTLLAEMNAQLVKVNDEVKINVDNLKKPILDVIELEQKVVKGSNEIVNAKQREAMAFKKYTEYEINLMKHFNNSLRHLTVEGTSLVPIDVYKNSGGHKSEYFKNYTSILNSVKRNANYVDRGSKKGQGKMFLGEGYYDDVPKFVQKRLKELLSDLGVVVSDVTDKEFKKIRSKLSGKMVEYLDISKLTPELEKSNDKWLETARNQLWDFQRFLKEVETHMSGLRRGKHKFYFDDFKKFMDSISGSMYEKYGVKGNPYINDFIKENNLKDYYKQFFKFPQEYTELNYGRNPVYISKKISDGMLSLERVLKQTAIDWDNLNNVEEQATQTVRKVTEAEIASARETLGLTNNVHKLGSSFKATLLPIKQVETALSETKYSFQELGLYFDVLPKKAQVAMQNIVKAIDDKHLGRYGKKPRKKMYEAIEKEFVNLPMLDTERLLREVSTESTRKASGINKMLQGTLATFKDYGNYNLLKEQLGLTDETFQQGKASLEEYIKTLGSASTEVKQLGDTTKYTAGQITVLKAIFEEAQKVASRTYLGGTPVTRDLFRPLYANLEAQFTQTLTGMNPKNVINPKKLQTSFQHYLKDLFDALGITLIKDVPEDFQMGNIVKKFQAMNFAGKRVGMYDVSNLIDEAEFKKLIGEVEELSVSEEKAVSSTDKLDSEIKKLGTDAQHTKEVIKKLSIATDEFGFVYLGDLISKFDQLPAHLQKAVSNVSRVIQKGHFGLYPKKGFEEYLSDLVYSAFPLADLPFNVNDPRYTSFFAFDTNISKEQLEDQKKLLDQILQTFGMFYPEEYKIIQGINRWGENQRTVKQELQYTLDTLKMTEPYVKSIATALTTLKASGLKFMTQEEWNYSPFLRRLLEEGNGFNFYSKIRPKNVEDRYYSVSDERFLEKVISNIYHNHKLYGKEPSFNSIDARHLFKYPSWKQLSTHEMINMPYSTEYIQNFQDGTKESYDKFIKYAHTQMRRALKPLGIELSTELSRTSEKAVRVWLDDLGKFKNIGSLDLSNMIKFDSFETAMAYIEKLTKNMASLGYQMDKTAMRTTTLNYALQENVNWQQRVSREQEKARIKAEQLAKGKRVGVELWGTAEEYRRAIIGFRNLMGGAIEFGKAEKVTAKSTDTLTNSLKKAVTQANYLQIALKEKPLAKFRNEFENMFFNPISNKEATVLDALYRINNRGFHGTIGQDQWLNEVLAWGKQIERLDIDKFVKSYIRLTDRAFNQKHHNLLNPFTSLGTSRTTGGNNGDGQLVGDGYWGKVTDYGAKSEAEVLREVLSLFNQIQIVARKTGETIAYSFEKPVQAVKQLEEAEKATAESTKQMSSAVEKSQACLDSFVGEIPKAVSAEKELETQNKKVAESFSKGLSFPIYTPTESSTYKGQVENIRQISKAFNEATNSGEKLVSTVKLLGTTTHFENLPMVVEQVSESFNKASESEKRFERQSENTARRVTAYYNNIFRQLNQWDKKHSFIRPIDSRNLKNWDIWGDGFARSGETIANTTKSLKTFDNTVLETANNIKTKLVGAMKSFYEMATQMEMKIPNQAFDSWKQAIAEIEGFEKRYRALSQRMYDLSRGRGYWQNQGKTNTGYGTLLALQKYNSFMEKYAPNRMLSAGGKLYDIQDMIATDKIDLFGKKGRINVEGYSDYIARISEVQGKLSQLTISTAEYKSQLLQLSSAIKNSASALGSYGAKADEAIISMSLRAEANERYAKTSSVGEKISALRKEMDSLSNSSTKTARALKGEAESLTALEGRFNGLSSKLREGKVYGADYDRELEKIASDLSKLHERTTRTAESVKKTDNSIKGASNSTRVFGENMGRSEAYANSLYRGLQKVRSVIISLKTIFHAMGGMMLWSFAFDLVESAKETYVAKNEIYSLLNQNAKVDAGGIQVFNKALDDTAKKFQKINKYSLGEAVASIGLEFNLSAGEMAKSMEVVSMIQSEYIRAGRTTDEANLAVKDILQGEFMRLSRETGIGKKDLMNKYGWNGDNTDVISMMNALEKAGKERHWDTFAEKATSLNDILTITKSRFSELGADIATVFEPTIIIAFNSIIDSINSLSNAFNGLNSFDQTMVAGTALPVAIVTLSSLFLALNKDIGLSEIALIGWKRSLLSAVFQLNTADVAQNGFLKTLIATISGLKAEEVANVRTTKLLAGRVLGLNQGILAEQSYGKALDAKLLKMKEGINVAMEDIHYHKLRADTIKRGIDVEKGKVNLERASILSMDKKKILTSELTKAEVELANIELTRSQRLAYLTTNAKKAEVANWSMSKSLLKTATSWKVLKLAIAGVLSLSFLSWFAGIAMWADAVKKRVDGFNDMVSNGATKLQEAQNIVDSYNEKLSKPFDNKREYSQTLYLQRIAVLNRDDIKRANELATQYDKINKETEKANDLMISGGIRDAYKKAGLKDVQEQSQYVQQIRTAQYDINKAEAERYKFEYASLQHINEHTALMEQANLDEEQRIKYVTEYSAKAKEAGQHLKEFNQGNLQSGIYYVMDRLSLMWIDMWNDPQFLETWKSLQKTWEGLQPTIRTLLGYIYQLKDALLGFLATVEGQAITAFTALGIGVGVVALKFVKWITGAKSVGVVLKDLGKKLVDRIKEWRNLGEEAEKANEKMGGEKSTGGVTGGKDKKKPEYEWSKEGWKGLGKDIGSDIMSEVRRFAKLSVQLAGAMFLVTEAIYLIQAPMWALAETGKTFKAKEKSIRAGIEGLQLIAPAVIAILIPTMALIKVMDKWGGKIMNVKTIGATALGIALGLAFVAEAILMLNAPLLTIASLGYTMDWQRDKIYKGVEAMKLVSDSLQYLVPFIPVLALSIGMMSLVFSGGGTVVGGILLAGAVAGIAVGMLLIAEAVLMLKFPLAEIANLGNEFTSLDGVKRGAEAIKLTAEALENVESAFESLAGIKWSLISDYIAEIVANAINLDLSQLSGEDGFFNKLKKFTEEFEKVEITPINQDKVKTLNDSATGIETVKNALNKVKEALKNLPNFNTDNRSPQEKYNDTVSGAVPTEGVSNYFEQLKQPIQQLKEFIDKFNSDEINVGKGVNMDKVAIIQQSADAIGVINTAIEKVKTALGNAVDASWNGNVASGGLLGGAVGLLLGDGNPASSSIKSGLDELYNCVKDIMDFNTKIAGLTSSQSGSQEGTVQASNMVSALQTEINNLKTTLSNAVPTIKSTATGIGEGIVEGVKSGISGKLGEIGTTAESMGKDTFVPKFKSGISKMSDAMSDELGEIGSAIDGKKEELGQKAYDLGKYMSDKFKEGDDINSPGIMARSISDEMGYIGQYLSDAQLNLPQMAYNLSNAMSTNFNFDFGLSGFQLPDPTELLGGFDLITSTVSNVRTSVSTDFNTIKTNVGNSFNGIVSNTRNNLANMQSQTTKNIGAIRTSWRGMQDALIASAENIRSQTGQKISTLQSNMASFWKKVQNPALLLGSAGSSTESRHTIKPKRAMGGTSIRNSAKGMLMAGSSKISGISDKFRPKGKGGSQTLVEHLMSYIECLENGGKCIAGGWSFDWSPSVKKSFNKWSTHFGQIYDDVLKVGKFENDDFPVRGNATIAKRYIADAISNTQYEHYYDYKYGSPLSAWLAGSFNCVEGASIAIALARAFGFGGGTIRYGTWDGEGHGFADIPGLGIIDATALQRGYGFRSPKVKGYGSHTLVNNAKTHNDDGSGETHNYNGDINLNINVYGDDVEVNENKVDKTTARSIIDLLGINPHTGL